MSVKHLLVSTLLWLLLLWGIVASGLGLLALGTGADLETLSMHRDLKELIANSAREDAQAMQRHVDGQAAFNTRIALLLLATGPMLVFACIVALRKPRSGR